jgi:uncharacterized protein YecE (DUF72 family)
MIEPRQRYWLRGATRGVGMAELRIGTCSWKFPSWEGLVYSAARDINYLEEYARQYDTVEVDQWFWSLFRPGDVVLPKAADVEEYRRAVPEGFRFTVKVPNSITLTHYHRKDNSAPLVPNPHYLSVPLMEAFLAALDPMRDLLGPLILQFEYLNRQKMPSQGRFLQQFGELAAQLPGGYGYALETRNPKYLDRAYFEFLHRTGLSPVLLQGYWMPPIARVYEARRPLILKQRSVVIRLLGPDRQGIEEETGKEWNQIVAPKDQELAETVTMVRDLLDTGIDVYLNVNNHYEGSAPLTIERIRELL